MLSTKIDIGKKVATHPTSVSVIAIAITPTMIGRNAATRAPKARMRIASVIGTSFFSLRLASSAETARMSRSSGARPVTNTL